MVCSSSLFSRVKTTYPEGPGADKSLVMKGTEVPALHPVSILCIPCRADDVCW